MLTYFRQNKFALFNGLFDVLSVVYVLVFKVNPARIIAFYWLDSCVMLFFFMLYFKYVGIISSYGEVIIASMVLILINYVSLPIIVGISGMSGNEIEVDQAYLLFQPYFDVGFFLTLSILSQMHFYNRMCSLADKGVDTLYVLLMNCIFTMFVLFSVVILAAFIYAVTMNPATSIIISFIVMRTLADRWRVKNLRKKEKEITTTED